jgi:AraC family transcriptional regulator, exoenzyme S synthesis regulatory protein ExsA
MPTKQINNNAEIVFTCSESVLYNTEMIAEEHSIVLVLTGELKVIQSQKTYVCKAGQALLFPRNQLSTLVKSAKDGLPYKAVVIKLTRDVLRAFYEQKEMPVAFIPKTDSIVPLPKSPLLDSFFNSILPYFDLEYKLPQDLSRLKVQEAITILRSINKDIDYILSDFSEPHKINLAGFMEHNYMFNMPIEKFAYLTGRSLTTFKRDFKKAFSTTPQKWLTEKRLELAHYQLSKNGRKPVDIFFEVGFENFSHFSYAFKKHFGHSPTELRQKN